MPLTGIDGNQEQKDGVSLFLIDDEEKSLAQRSCIGIKNGSDKSKVISLIKTKDPIKITITEKQLE